MILNVKNVKRYGAGLKMDEMSLDFDGLNYLVLFGHHVNGGFIALPNAGVCVEASGDPNETGYNSEQLQLVGIPEDHADTIAHAIKVFSEVMGEEENDGKA